MQRNALILSIVAVAVGIAITLIIQALINGNPSPPPPPVISKLHDMGELVTLKSSVADVIEFTSQTNPLPIPWSNWNLPIGTTTVILIAKGDCLIATDLRKAKYEPVIMPENIKIVLPVPSLLKAGLNWNDDQSKIYAISKTGINRLMPGKTNVAINGAMKLAEQKISDSCKNPEAINKAKENTNMLINGMYSGLGWKANIEWNSP